MAKRIISIFTVSVLIVIILGSCSKEDNPGNFPELPPIDAILMDFSDFASDPTQTALKSADEYGNFVFSYATVTIWNAMTAIYMAVPVASYLGALEQTPEYLGENSWQWTYTVSAGQDSYTAKLITERISNEEFSAQMLITKDGFFADFKWFEGVLRYDLTHAKWTLYESPLNNEAWLEIEWIRDRRTWIMYLIVNGVREEWAKLARIRPDEGFYKVLSEHVGAYVHEGVMPPEEIAPTVLNVGDDLMSGREVTLKAGDYIAVQNFIRKSK